MFVIYLGSIENIRVKTWTVFHPFDSVPVIWHEWISMSLLYCVTHFSLQTFHILPDFVLLTYKKFWIKILFSFINYRCNHVQLVGHCFGRFTNFENFLLKLIVAHVRYFFSRKTKLAGNKIELTRQMVKTEHFNMADLTVARPVNLGVKYWG